MTHVIDATEEVEDLAAALAACASLRARVGSALEGPAGGVSEWSAAQHLYHVTLATDLALRNVLSLTAGEGLLIVHEGEPTALARRLLEQGSFPRGQSQAPRMVRPPQTVDALLLDEEMRRARESLAGVRERRADLAAAAGRIPHQILGPLNALEWLRFARLHTRHHLEILEDIEAAIAG